MAAHPIPSAAFDALVEEELASLSALLAQSGKSIAVILVASSGIMAENYCHLRARPNDRPGILEGLRTEIRDLAERWA